MTIDKLESDLQAIEADTYAEFVRSGQLNELPAFVLPEFFQARND